METIRQRAASRRGNGVVARGNGVVARRKRRGRPPETAWSPAGNGVVARRKRRGRRNSLGSCGDHWV
ncbi:hypothetical protein, partial [Kribbella sp. NPDC004875]|uniref:hypothetical protein n=1 Tax=Kribbella sp. NPDC004875 TaxID=3364107 RepID=UPI0036CB58B6